MRVRPLSVRSFGLRRPRHRPLSPGAYRRSSWYALERVCRQLDLPLVGRSRRSGQWYRPQWLRRLD
jgi:hypothetical protein